MYVSPDGKYVHGAASKGAAATGIALGAVALGIELFAGGGLDGFGFGRGTARGIEKDVFMVELAKKDAIIANQNAKLYANEAAEKVEEKLECIIAMQQKEICKLQTQAAVDAVEDRCMREEIKEIACFLKQITLCGIKSTSVITPPATT